MSLRVGDLELGRTRATWRGRAVRLRPMELRLLAHLAARAGRTQTRESLLREVWGREGAARTLEVHISRLRRALDGGGAAIVTVRRVGYRLDPERLA